MLHTDSGCAARGEVKEGSARLACEVNGERSSEGAHTRHGMGLRGAV
jgi:hypothetical protein